MSCSINNLHDQYKEIIDLFENIIDDEQNIQDIRNLIKGFLNKNNLMNNEIIIKHLNGMKINIEETFEKLNSNNKNDNYDDKNHFEENKIQKQNNINNKVINSRNYLEAYENLSLVLFMICEEINSIQIIGFKKFFNEWRCRLNYKQQSLIFLITFFICFVILEEFEIYNSIVFITCVSLEESTTFFSFKEKLKILYGIINLNEVKSINSLNKKGSIKNSNSVRLETNHFKNTEDIHNQLFSDHFIFFTELIVLYYSEKLKKTIKFDEINQNLKKKDDIFEKENKNDSLEEENYSIEDFLSNISLLNLLKIYIFSKNTLFSFFNQSINYLNHIFKNVIKINHENLNEIFEALFSKKNKDSKLNCYLFLQLLEFTYKNNLENLNLLMDSFYSKLKQYINYHTRKIVNKLQYERLSNVSELIEFFRDIIELYNSFFNDNNTLKNCGIYEQMNSLFSYCLVKSFMENDENYQIYFYLITHKLLDLPISINTSNNYCEINSNDLSKLSFFNCFNILYEKIEETINFKEFVNLVFSSEKKNAKDLNEELLLKKICKLNYTTPKIDNKFLYDINSKFKKEVMYGLLNVENMEYFFNLFLVKEINEIFFIKDSINIERDFNKREDSYKEMIKFFIESTFAKSKSLQFSKYSPYLIQTLLTNLKNKFIEIDDEGQNSLLKIKNSKIKILFTSIPFHCFKNVTMFMTNNFFRVSKDDDNCNISLKSNEDKNQTSDKHYNNIINKNSNILNFMINDFNVKIYKYLTIQHLNKNSYVIYPYISNIELNINYKCKKRLKINELTNQVVNSIQLSSKNSNLSKEHLEEILNEILLYDSTIKVDNEYLTILNVKFDLLSFICVKVLINMLDFSKQKTINLFQLKENIVNIVCLDINIISYSIKSMISKQFLNLENENVSINQNYVISCISLSVEKYYNQMPLNVDENLNISNLKNNLVQNILQKIDLRQNYYNISKQNIEIAYDYTSTFERNIIKDNVTQTINVFFGNSIANYSVNNKQNKDTISDEKIDCLIVKEVKKHKKILFNSLIENLKKIELQFYSSVSINFEEKIENLINRGIIEKNNNFIIY